MPKLAERRSSAAFSDYLPALADRSPAPIFPPASGQIPDPNPVDAPRSHGRAPKAVPTAHPPPQVARSIRRRRQNRAAASGGDRRRSSPRPRANARFRAWPWQGLKDRHRVCAPFHADAAPAWQHVLRLQQPPRFVIRVGRVVAATRSNGSLNWSELALCGRGRSRARRNSRMDRGAFVPESRARHLCAIRGRIRDPGTGSH